MSASGLSNSSIARRAAWTSAEAGRRRAGEYSRRCEDDRHPPNLLDCGRGQEEHADQERPDGRTHHHPDRSSVRAHRGVRRLLHLADEHPISQTRICAGLDEQLPDLDGPPHAAERVLS